MLLYLLCLCIFADGSGGLSRGTADLHCDPTRLMSKIALVILIQCPYIYLGEVGEAHPMWRVIFRDGAFFVCRMRHISAANKRTKNDMI